MPTRLFPGKHIALHDHEQENSAVLEVELLAKISNCTQLRCCGELYRLSRRLQTSTRKVAGKAGAVQSSEKSDHVRDFHAQLADMAAQVSDHAAHLAESASAC